MHSPDQVLQVCQKSTSANSHQVCMCANQVCKSCTLKLQPCRPSLHVWQIIETLCCIFNRDFASRQNTLFWQHNMQIHYAKMQWQLIIMHRMLGKVTKPSAQPCKLNLQNVHNELGETKHRYATNTHVQTKFAQTKKHQKSASQSD